MVDKENLGDNNMSSEQGGGLHRGRSFQGPSHAVFFLTQDSTRPRDTAKEKHAYIAQVRPPRGERKPELLIPGLQASVCTPRCS